MRLYISVLILLICISNSVSAQLSEGGFPLQVISQKSAEQLVVKMPALKQTEIDAAMQENRAAENQLKPLTFAHVFNVDLNPANSGVWYTTNAGYNVWKITLSSENAYSLNLIFDDFELNAKGRLFLYNEKTNHYLGAFTSNNNAASQKFAVAPVAGDEITVQYEVPKNAGTPNDFTITRVNHDFMGILKFDRRPIGGDPAGDCNVDVNCEIGDNWNQLKDAVCRLIVDGREVCSGTLVNNTAEDKTPYVLSASHCYDAWDLAETTVYTFNYESPYCAPLDGDPIHSLSGAVMKAHFDSLDFALVELNDIPPPDFRPYYAGWDRSSGLPDSSVSIHHPMGDVKKISFDYDAPEYATFKSSSIKNPTDGSLKVLYWDEGVTEVGSSGGALFNMKDQLIGTLSGGAAVCGSPVNDYYARFAMQWDFQSDSTKQLKYWLDPAGTAVLSLDGKQFNTGDDLCNAFTHLNDADEHGNITITVSGESAGFWGGTNSVGIEEIVERFAIDGNEILDGISFGVGKLITGNNNSSITVKVYNGNSFPEDLIYSKSVTIDNWAEDAMNFVGFDEMVQPADTFFVGFELSDIQPADTFAIYQSLREFTGAENHCYLLQDGTWKSFSELNPQDYAMVNVMELVACNYRLNTDTQVVDQPENVMVYPNPTAGELTLESDKTIDPKSIKVFNLIGQEMQISVSYTNTYHTKINLLGKTPGVYFVRFSYGDSFVTRKISFVPW
ncbi:T9SS type A sorting domain-containing protein [Draconibacterium sp. IB214405]|uniref:T9SS type A sorting domain-containing protein n=1 Tax=Draconibacterium sp. IB214405 TaxID=3097352 RepID=UPI002A150FF1|nr:T9SS type A sorting domain-containing protein [Draconibacterium sp. IB214405]MDX8340089.1 T9SS type A sorting domain-containing protein [Draconibacterium sp. IB214405]